LWRRWRIIEHEIRKIAFGIILRVACSCHCFNPWIKVKLRTVYSLIVPSGAVSMLAKAQFISAKLAFSIWTM
jgi:hypothetical protein